MRRSSKILALGVWTALIPFLGFPGTWETILIVASGAMIAFLSLLTVIEDRNNHTKGPAL